MATRPDAAPVRSGVAGTTEILAPTLLEYLAVRAVRPSGAVVHTGVGLGRRGCSSGAVGAVVCGLAGGLDPALAPGTIVVPSAVATPDGLSRQCDPALVSALRDGARALGFEPRSGPMLTAPQLVTGPARGFWAARGFIAADMETALLPSGMPVATVRVILDAVARPISERWTTPGAALGRPGLLREFFWLSWAAPRYALRAARVLDAGLARLG